MKYCNRCGAHLVTTKGDDTVKLFEKRMDSEMEGLFWITVLGLALILGGMALLKKVQLSESLIIAYMILSSVAFIAYFGFRSLASSSAESKFQRGKWKCSAGRTGHQRAWSSKGMANA